MKTFLKNLFPFILKALLFVLAVTLAVALLPLGIIYSFVRRMIGMRFKDWMKLFGDYFFALAHSVDQFGNVMLGDIMNDTLARTQPTWGYEEQTQSWYVSYWAHPYKFGHMDETISSAIGKNKANGTLTVLGKFISWLLDTIDPNHSIKSIDNTIKNGESTKD